MLYLKNIKLSAIIASFFLIALLFVAAPLATAQQTVDQGIKGSVNCGAGINLKDSTCAPNASAAGSGTNSIQNIIKTVINVFSAIVGAIAVIMIIVGGFRYITSGGDSNNVGGAKNTIIYAIVGLVIVALAQIIVKFVLEKSTS